MIGVNILIFGVIGAFIVGMILGIGLALTEEPDA